MPPQYGRYDPRRWGRRSSGDPPHPQGFPTQHESLGRLRLRRCPKLFYLSGDEVVQKVTTKKTYHHGLVVVFRNDEENPPGAALPAPHCAFKGNGPWSGCCVQAASLVVCSANLSVRKELPTGRFGDSPAHRPSLLTDQAQQVGDKQQREQQEEPNSGPRPVPHRLRQLPGSFHKLQVEPRKNRSG